MEKTKHSEMIKNIKNDVGQVRRGVHDSQNMAGNQEAGRRESLSRDQADVRVESQEAGRRDRAMGTEFDIRTGRQEAGRRRCGNQETGKRGRLTAVEAARSFNAGFLSTVTSTQWLTNAIHEGGPPTCPACGTQTDDTMSFFWRAMPRARRKCKVCGKWFTLVTGTILQGSKLRPEQVYLMAVLLGLGLENGRIAEIVDVSIETVRQWRMKLDG